MNTMFLKVLIKTFSTGNIFYGKYIFDEPKKFSQFFKELSPDIKKYEFCWTYDFKQLIKGPTRATWSTSTLINHILTKKYISQSGIIDTALSDHSTVYCARKISRAIYNKHKEITFPSLINYSVYVYKEALDDFDNLDLAYSNFLLTIKNVINIAGPI